MQLALAIVIHFYGTTVRHAAYSHGPELKLRYTKICSLSLHAPLVFRYSKTCNVKSPAVELN